MTTAVPSYIARGEALLDRELGTGWPLIVDTERLTQPEPDRCVAGQVAQSVGGDWGDLCIALGVWDPNRAGFGSAGTRQWKRLIVARQVEIITKLDSLKTKRAKRAYVQTLLHPSIRKGAK